MPHTTKTPAATPMIPPPRTLASVEEHNEHAKAMKWTALPDDILAKVRHARAVLDKTPSE